MATWTEEEKSGGIVYDQDMLIEGTYQLLIGDGFSLLIQVAGDGTTWTEPSKPADATFTNVTKN
jgi:hypothetical protein